MVTPRSILFVLLSWVALGAWGQTKPQQASRASDRDTISPVLDTLQLPKDTASASEFDQPIFYESTDSIYFSVTGQRAFLYRGAKLSNDNISLDADYIHIDMANNLVYATGVRDTSGQLVGRPVFKDGNQTFESDSIRYNIKTKKGLVKNVFSEQSGGYLHGGVTKMQDNKHIHVNQGMYTTCDLEHPHFYINLTKAKVIPNEKIVSGPLYFVILDVPTPLLLPFGYFPSNTKRQSGILIPRYGEDQQRGFFLSDGGYYWAINQFVDMALVGSIYSRGSWDVTARSKYKLRYRFSGDLNFRYARNIIGEEGLPGYVDKNSYSLQLTHRQDPKANPYQQFSVQVKYEGGEHRRLNSTNYADYTNTYNNSSVSYAFTPNQKWNLTAGATATQNTSNGQVTATLPNVNINVNRGYFFGNNRTGGKKKWYEKIEYRYTAQAKADIRGIDTTLLSDRTRVSAGFKHDLPISANYKFLKHFTLSPSVSYKGVLYPYWVEKNSYPKLLLGDVVKRDSVITDTIAEIKYGHSITPNLSVGFAPQIFGFFTFGPKSKVAAIRHLISPSVTMSIAPDGRRLSPSIFRQYRYQKTTGEWDYKNYSIFDNGIFGSPTPGAESGAVSFALQNQFEMKLLNATDSVKDPKDKYRKVGLIERFNLNTAYNFYAEEFQWQDIRMNASTKLFQNKIGATINGGFTLYDHDSATGRAVDVFRFDNNKSPLRFTGSTLSLDATIDPAFFKSKSKAKDQKPADDKTKAAQNPYQGVKWSFRVNYNFSYFSNWNAVLRQFEPRYNQTMNVVASLDVTSKWKLSANTGWDFTARKLSPTTLNFNRDLHCWEMRMTWIPFGTLKSYQFQINVKSSIFEGIKYQMQETIQRTIF